MTAAKPDMPETPSSRLSVVVPRFSDTGLQEPPELLGKMLRFASSLGLAMGCGSIALIAYALMSWSMHSAVTGWTSLTAIVLAMGSTQLLDLRRFGEYLDRMDVETESQPLYVADSTISSSTQTQYEEAGVPRRMAA